MEENETTIEEIGTLTRNEIRQRISSISQDLEYLKDEKSENDKKDMVCIVFIIVGLFFMYMPFWTFVVVALAIYFILTRSSRDNISRTIYAMQTELEELAEQMKFAKK